MKFGHLEKLDNIDFSLPAISNNFEHKNNSAFKDVNFFIGAPVWGDKNYLGTLFPKETKQKDYLFQYAKQFNSIEVNATRFGTPKRAVLDNWINAVNENFKFSLKVPQIITHRKDINDIKSRHQLNELMSFQIQIQKFTKNVSKTANSTVSTRFTCGFFQEVVGVRKKNSKNFTWPSHNARKMKYD